VCRIWVVNGAVSTQLGRMTVRIAALSGWTSEQKHVVAASFLGWTLDAFDFVLLLFVLKDIALESRHSLALASLNHA
jgi:hypothetical protein